MAIADREHPPTIEDFPVRIFRKGDTLVLKGPTWQFSPKLTFREFLVSWDEDPIAALRDIASEPPRQDNEFGTKVYPAIHIVEQAANPSRRHPLRDDGSFEEFFRPVFANYHLRFDLAASRDAAGIAMVHLDAHTHRIAVDLVHEVLPPKQGEIRLQALENLVYSLIARGFRIVKVSFDQAHSSQFRQNLEARGIRCEKLSVDRTTEAHETLFGLIHAGHLDFYAYPPLLSNLDSLYLLPGGKKIDHPPGASKDVSDALAGAIMTCIRDEGFQRGDPEIIPLEDPEEKPSPSSDGKIEQGSKVDEEPDPYDLTRLDKDDDGIPF